MNLRTRLVALVLVTLAGACSSSPGDGTGSPDASTPEDAQGDVRATDAPGARDAAEAGVPEATTGSEDATVPEAGPDAPGAQDAAEAGVPEGSTELGDATLPEAGEAGVPEGSTEPGDATLPEAGDDASETGAPEASVSDAEAGTPDAADTSEGGGPVLCVAPPSCGSGQKACNFACVSTSSPDVGCGATSCTACALPHAQAGCSTQGACSVAACEPGFADCNGDPTDGCEADLTSAATCGSCQTSCTGGTPMCTPTGCAASCTPPLSACGTSCVDLATSAEHCGTCNTSCGPSPLTGAGQCAGGSCVAPACLYGLTACDGGCTDTTANPLNCGACGNVCSGDCVGSTCQPVCPVGKMACGGGTCTVTATDSANCGTCGHACATSEVCTGGQCALTTSPWLATGLSGPADLVVDDTSVYWTEATAGTVNAVPKGGGAVVPLAQAQSKPEFLALDDAYVYWGNNLGGAVMRAPKDGSGAPQLVTAVTSPGYVAVWGSDVFVCTTTGLYKAAKDGSVATATLFASLTCKTPFADGSHLYDVAPIPGGVIGQEIEAVDLTTGTISSAGPPEIHVTAALAVSGDIIATSQLVGGPLVEWYTSPAQTEDWSVRVSGVEPSSIALVPCGVAWGDKTQAGLTLGLLGRSTPVTLTSQAQVQALTSDGQALYWIDATNAIGRFALP